MRASRTLEATGAFGAMGVPGTAGVVGGAGTAWAGVAMGNFALHTPFY